MRKRLAANEAKDHESEFDRKDAKGAKTRLAKVCLRLAEMGEQHERDGGSSGEGEVGQIVFTTQAGALFGYSLFWAIVLGMDDGEHGLFCDYGDASAHFHINDDCGRGEAEELFHKAALSCSSEWRRWPNWSFLMTAAEV